jgi:hypothetical protein
MDNDSPFAHHKDENIVDRKIGIRNINIYFCQLCYHIWKSPNAEKCLLCGAKEGLMMLHSYTTNYVRV